MTRVVAVLRRLPSLLLIGIVRIYQLTLSPMLGPTCRFYPSCSAYAVGALREHGAVRGSWLAVRRLGRCHPWNPGGVDPVPSRERPAAHPAGASPQNPVPPREDHHCDSSSTPRSTAA